MTDLSVTVPASLDGVRVDKAVALVADVPRALVNDLIGSGRVVLDGTPVSSRSTRLKMGQELTVSRGPAPVAVGPEPDATVELTVVHEDDDIIVVDKQAGLVVHPGAGRTDGTMVNGLLERFPELGAMAHETGTDPQRPGIVHRLDRGTSGLMVVARNPEAYRSLVHQLGERSVFRRYQALVLGSIDGESGVVDAPVGRSVSSPTRMAVTRRGKEARTRYRVAGRFSQPAPTTLVTASLETGRTHQIRVHLSAIGHPVVADEVYSRGRTLPGCSLDRPFLHAFSLAFAHPRSGSQVSWESPLPDDLRRQLALLQA